MSVNRFHKTPTSPSEELELIASKGQRVFVGTKSAVDSAIAAGDIGNNSIVYITDDNDKRFPDPVMPIGSIIPFAGTKTPFGYLLCDGSTFDETLYADLKTLLGTNTTPDLRGRFLMGSTPTEAVRTKIDEQLPNIKGGLSTNVENSMGGFYKYYSKASGPFKFGEDTGRAWAHEGESTIHFLKSLTFDASESGTKKVWKDDVDGVPVKVRPDTFVVTYIIKAL